MSTDHMVMLLMSTDHMVMLLMSTGEREEEFAPLKMSESIQDQIDQFKEHIPVVHILANPGLRERHWVKMSEIIGFNITPDSGTSLRKACLLGFMYCSLLHGSTNPA